MSISESKKLSFGELAEVRDTAHHNSNMQNLVTAAKMCDQDIEILNEEISRVAALRAEIIAFAEGPEENITNTDEVKRLYNFASQEPIMRRKRW